MSSVSLGASMTSGTLLILAVLAAEMVLSIMLERFTPTAYVAVCSRLTTNWLGSEDCHTDPKIEWAQGHSHDGR